MLAGTGLPRLEVTSFVRPDVIPQLADAAEVLAAVTRPADVGYSVLIPNERGLERALRSGSASTRSTSSSRRRRATTARRTARSPSRSTISGEVARAREKDFGARG